MLISWLSGFAQKWSAAIEAGRAPHAVLLEGPAGVGKRAAATWMVAKKLGLPADENGPSYPYTRAAHADLHWLEKPEDKHSILIDQVRGLVNDLALTSYEGRGKVAVIDPANAMNNNAANSLLKTLEEPPGDTLLILIADKAGRLPATIFSRCQRIGLRVPSEAEGLDWLDRLQPGTAWSDALHMAGLAPLGALSSIDLLDTSAHMHRDFAALAEGQASAVDVARAWAKLDPAFVLQWLARQVHALAIGAAGARSGSYGPGVPDSVLQRIDSRNLFCYLDNINRLRGQAGGSFNVQLALEGLLIDWATGLREIQRTSAVAQSPLSIPRGA